jgi:hypothetical protein
MPGFVEAHGHPLMGAIVLSDRMVDIRPVTIVAPTTSSMQCGAKSPTAGPTARISTAGTRCCRTDYRSRR